MLKNVELLYVQFLLCYLKVLLMSGSYCGNRLFCVQRETEVLLHETTFSAAGLSVSSDSESRVKSQFSWASV